jgi:plastocyanin
MKNPFGTLRVLLFLVLTIVVSVSTQAANVNVVVQNNRFTPAAVTVAVNDTVTWIFRENGHDTQNKSGSTYGNIWNSGIKPINTTFVFTFTTAGTFPYVCKPHENIGMTGTITVQGAANTPPTVSLTSPADGAAFTTSDTITFSADASDPGGSIAKVEFFRGGTTKIGEDTSAPYSLTASLPAGSHSITARATDNLGATTTSAARTITVNAPNQAPTVTLTSPANGATVLTTDTITFSADATDDAGVTKVEFFAGANLIGAADTSAPYSVTAQLPAGTHTITARATDAGNLTTTSASITITVNTPNTPPTVTLTSPANSATFLTTDTITFSANASDNGSIAKVEFLSHGSLIGAADTTAPYSITASLPAGSHVITAIATDNAGLTTTTPGITITVNTPTTSAPTVTLTSQQGGTTISTTGTVTLSATATDDGQVTQVEFFNGGTSISVDTTAPYEASVSNLAPGTYTFTAVARDNTGATTTSTGIQVRVAAAPQASVTRDGNTITIAATGTNGVTYDLEGTTDFVTWTKISSATPTAGTMSFTDTMGPTMRFYRVVAR